MIPLVDLKAQYQSLKAEIDSAIAAVIENTDFINGAAVERFERGFATLQGTSYAVGCASGTGAIFLLLRALGVQPGDEIITTPHTFIATVEPIEEIGAIPVFVDIDPQTYNIDPKRIEAAITPRTVGIMPVHLYGQMATMDEIVTIAERHHLWVIEDAAQAHDASYLGKKAGQWGTAAAFSFYPGKNLGAYGDAGAICTQDESLANRVAKLRNHGRTDKYSHDVIGYGERIDTIQAAILEAKLPMLPAWSVARRAHAAYYSERLSDVAGIITPTIMAGNVPVFHIYCIRMTGDRDALLQGLKARGIGAGIHYPIPLHLQPALAHRGYREGDFPEAEAAAGSIISLPLYPELTTAQRDVVIDAVREVVGEGQRSNT